MAMPSRHLRTLIKWTLYLCVLGGVIGLYAWISPAAFARVPSYRDPSFSGDWYVDRFGSFRKYTFEMDGTGEILSAGRDPRPFRWGVEDGVLQLKYQTQMGWQAPQYKFQRHSQDLVIQDVQYGSKMTLKRQVPTSGFLQ